MPIPIYAALPVVTPHTLSPLLADDQESRFANSGVPVMAGALIQLELLLRERSIDLEAVSHVVRGDIGLTIEVLRSARIESENEELWRISDGVIELRSRILELATPLRRTDDHRHAYDEVEAFWMHARLVATVAEMTAGYFHELQENSEQAYIAGLLHNLKRLPKVLKLLGIGCDLSGILYGLPFFVTDVVESVHSDQNPSEMSALARIVDFAAKWVGLCLPWAETCMAKRRRFSLPLIQAANVVCSYFPETGVDPLVPFIELLQATTIGCLEEERPVNSSVLAQTNSGFQRWMGVAHQG
jgi:hypothetical protein